jgi:23S rRNA-/tRNA-specific pseudouridylate synthase
MSKNNDMINPEVEGKYEIITIPENPKAWCIKVTDGDWKGIVYTYNKVDLKEEKKKLVVQSECDILFVPEEQRRMLTEEQYNDWEVFKGKILINVMHKHSDLFVVDKESGKVYLEIPDDNK